MGVAADRDSGRHVEVVEPGRVEAEDLALGVGSELPVLAHHVLRDGEVHELLDQPLGVPDGIVARPEEAVLSQPVEKLAEHLGEVPRPGEDEGHGHGQTAVDVGLLDPDPAEVLEAGQPAVLDDEVELREGGGSVVDVGDVERVPVERPDGGALVDVDIADAELGALLQVATGPGV